MDACRVAPSDSLWGMGKIIADSSSVTVRQLSVSTMDNNVYLLTHKATGEQLLIDAADDAAAIGELLVAARVDTTRPTRLKLVVTTHQHWDHIRALAQVASDTGAATAVGAADAEGVERQTGVRADLLLSDGDEIELGLGDLRLRVISLRGHTPGSVALALAEPDEPAHLFTGDSLFPGGVGNTEGSAERFGQLFADVSAKLFNVYPDDAIVHPGHGLSTTLGAERPHLSEWERRGW
jgi:glyoxylase-like metal-dependent hydrolase (beta-lactamase superfamily II)